MTRINANTPNRRLSAKLVGGLAISALLALGAFAPANAEWRGDDHAHNWGGGYYSAPPVVYGSPYGSGYYGAPGYYAPPAVYGPAVGISLGGIEIGIRQVSGDPKRQRPAPMSAVSL
jgi:hypothetical protein